MHKRYSTSTTKSLFVSIELWILLHSQTSLQTLSNVICCYQAGTNMPEHQCQHSLMVKDLRGLVGREASSDKLLRDREVATTVFITNSCTNSQPYTFGRPLGFRCSSWRARVYRGVSVKCQKPVQWSTLYRYVEKTVRLSIVQDRNRDLTRRRTRRCEHTSRHPSIEAHYVL